MGRVGQSQNRSCEDVQMDDELTNLFQSQNCGDLLWIGRQWIAWGIQNREKKWTSNDVERERESNPQLWVWRARDSRWMTYPYRMTCFSVIFEWNERQWWKPSDDVGEDNRARQEEFLFLSFLPINDNNAVNQDQKGRKQNLKSFSFSIFHSLIQAREELEISIQILQLPQSCSLFCLHFYFYLQHSHFKSYPGLQFHQQILNSNVNSLQISK